MNVRAGIVHTSYSSFAIVAGKDPKEGRRLWLVLPRGPAKLRDQERMMRRPRLDLARSVLLRLVIGRGVVSIAALLEPVIVNVNAKPHLARR
jgi:hypothetical protein